MSEEDPLVEYRCFLLSCQGIIPEQAEHGFWSNQGGLDFCCKEHWLVFYGQKKCNRSGCGRNVFTIEFIYDNNLYCSIECRRQFVQHEKPYYPGQRPKEE